MSKTILSVERAMNILLFLYNAGQEVGISEIGRELDLHKSTIHRTLTTLESKGFIYQNKENGKYWLGLKIYAMGLLIEEKLSLKDIIKPYAKKVFDEFHEVVNVSILDKVVKEGYKTVVILKESENKKVLSVNPNVGSSLEAHASSVGKCLLAFSDDVDIERFSNIEFKKYTKNTISDYNELIKELNNIRKKGYAIDNEEREVGLFCIGAPILNKNGNAIAAISISGPTVRMKNEDIDKKIAKLIEVANEISLDVKQFK